MNEIESLKQNYMMHSLVGVLLDAIKRNGLEKTLEDLNQNCRLSPESGEDVYQGMLKCISSISERHERIAEKKRGS